VLITSPVASLNAFFPRERKKEIKGGDRKGLKKSYRSFMTTATKNGQRNPTRSFGSQLARVCFMFFGTPRLRNSGGRLRLRVFAERLTWRAVSSSFIRRNHEFPPASSFLHVRNGHHVPRCLRRNKKKNKEKKTCTHSNSRCTFRARGIR
jgi:hypothetical protein